MEDPKQIKVTFNKAKLLRTILRCTIAVALGIYVLMKTPKGNIPVLDNVVFRFIVGMGSILFFGLIGFLFLKKLTSNAPGLIISDGGILDNTSGVNVGFVRWEDVIEIKENKMLKYVRLAVKNPKEYIGRQESIFKRKALLYNYNSFGTVIGISVDKLNCTYSELRTMINSKLADLKNK